MPTLIFKGVKQSDLQVLAKPLIEQLAETVECPKDWFTLEWSNPSYFDENGLVEWYPIINVNWFPRSKEMQDKVAHLVGKLFRDHGYARVKVSFTIMDREAHYDFK